MCPNGRFHQTLYLYHLVILGINIEAAWMWFFDTCYQWKTLGVRGVGMHDDDSGTLNVPLNISGSPVWKVPFLRMVV
jgi:hypothetical protein